jgi:hypothetical protein
VPGASPSAAATDAANLGPASGRHSAGIP